MNTAMGIRDKDGEALIDILEKRQAKLYRKYAGSITAAKQRLNGWRPKIQERPGALVLNSTYKQRQRGDRIWIKNSRRP